MIVKDEGILFDCKAIFEKDRNADIFLKQYGRQRVLIKNAQSFRSQRARVMQPFTKVSFVLYSRKSYLYLKECESLDMYSGLRESYQTYQQAAFFLKVIRESVLIGQKNKALYQLLDQTLMSITSEAVAEEYEKRFFLGFLNSEGILKDSDAVNINKKRFLELINSYTGGNIEDYYGEIK